MDEIATSLLRMRGPAPIGTVGPVVNRTPAETERDAPAQPAAQRERFRERLFQEFGIRIAFAALVVVFNELFSVSDETTSIIRVTALLGLGLNVPYLLGVRTGRALRVQAYLRMLIDVGLITAGLYGAGGLAAAHYIGIHAIVPVYAAIVFSSVACGVAVMVATVSYVTVAMLQLAGVLAFTRAPLPDASVIAAFNLLVLNLLGWLAALLAEAYRASQRHLASLYTELERAHDESLRVNAQIQRVSQRYVLSEVVTGVTHDVRDALQGVLGHVWLARRGAPGLPEESVAQLGEAERACERAMRILSTTLDMAQRPAVEREPVVLADLVRRVANLKAVELRRDGITLQVEVPTTLPRVPAAPFQLQQVLVNLVANAQDELRGRVGRREIAIVGKETPEGVALEVRDTGNGILPTHLPHVFEPFYSTRAGASGLGLAISAGVVESLGGRLTAENRREGGALFRLTLPPAIARPPKTDATRSPGSS